MKLLNFWRMQRKEKIIFFINFAFSAIIRAAIYCSSYQYLSKYFGKPCGMIPASTLASPKQKQQALNLRRMIALAARNSPWKSTCLVQALLAKFWCHRYGLPYFFFIGVDKQQSRETKHIAHAWLMVGPIAVTGGNCFETHHIIRSFSNIRTL